MTRTGRPAHHFAKGCFFLFFVVNPLELFPNLPLEARLADE
jgi:hypothetical protein